MNNKNEYVNLTTHMLRTLFTILILVVSTSFLQAQSGGADDANRKRYERAKQQFDAGQYAQALDLFSPLSQAAPNNPYATYASYFYALSAFYSQNYQTAKDMLLQIKTKYPKWTQQAQVDYWLANTYFELQDYPQALTVLQRIQNSQEASRSLKEDAEAMGEFYLRSVNDVAQLQTLQAQYPDNKTIATQLVSNVVRQNISQPELVQLKDQLVQKFKIDEAAYGIGKASSIKKEVYNIAAFLPFLTDKLNPSGRIGNQFVINLYAGMELAVEDLKKEGIDVQLYAYDTQQDYGKTQEILEQNEMLGMDVIVGPLYPGPFRAVSQFSQEHQVYMFNPLSKNPLAIANNPFAYLTNPSTVTEAQQAAFFTKDTLNRNKAIVVTEGGTRQDTARVNAFARNFQADRNHQVEVMELADFNQATMEAFVELLQTMGDSTVVYVASDQELVITNTVSAVVMAAGPYTLMGNDAWLDISTISYDQLEDLDTYLLNASYMDYSSKQIRNFQQAYRQKYFTVPDKYAYAGYDMMYFIGQMLNRYGIYFQEFFTENKPVKSLFFQGYNYYQSNDNQLIPIVRFEEGVLKETE